MITDLAICISGSKLDQNRINTVKSYINSVLNNYLKIYYFQDFSEDYIFKNWFKTCFKKQSHEINQGLIFKGCLAINLSHHLVKDNLEELLNKNNIQKIFEPDINTLYFFSGDKRDTSTNTLKIDSSGFFANSFIFNLACNYAVTNISVIKDRDANVATNFENLFYWYLKSLKIKTECINYENSSLFKRPTQNN